MPYCIGAFSRTLAWSASGSTFCATLSLQNGVDIKTVFAMLGHYDAGFTLRTYTHTMMQKQDQAAQAMGTLMAQVR